MHAPLTIPIEDGEMPILTTEDFWVFESGNILRARGRYAAISNRTIRWIPESTGGEVPIVLGKTLSAGLRVACPGARQAKSLFPALRICCYPCGIGTRVHGASA